MSKPYTIVIGLATALLVLGVAAPAPVYPAAPPSLPAGRLVVLRATGPFVTAPSGDRFIKVGDSVTLVASATGSQGPSPWKVEIQGYRLQGFWSVLQSCPSLPCSARVNSKQQGTFTFRAVLGLGS